MRNVALMGNIIYVVYFYRVIYGTMKVRILWNYVQNTCKKIPHESPPPLFAVDILTSMWPIAPEGF